VLIVRFRGKADNTIREFNSVAFTVWGAHFYFWGRVVHAILYTADLPLARSLVWNIPTIGILMNVAGLFLK
jgi:uncharacterized MAPEG superfamily protein